MDFGPASNPESAMMRRTITALGLALLVSACRTPDPQKELEVSDLEAYYAIERKAGDTLFISPVVRFRLRNKSAVATRPIQASANFRRVGEGETWGGAWVQVTPAAKPLQPGAEVTVTLQSEGHYTISGEAEDMFKHELYRDVTSEAFLRVGASGWVKMAAAPVARRIGPLSAQETK
jgi:hypothetical protein